MPEKVSKVQDAVKPYFNFRDELIVQDGVFSRGERIVIPFRMRQDMLNKIHKSYTVEECLRRACENIFWPRNECRDQRFYKSL